MVEVELMALDQAILAARRALLAERQARARVDTLQRLDRQRQQQAAGEETDNQRLARLEADLDALERRKTHLLFEAVYLAGGK